MIKLVITDIGGVLVKTDEAIIESIREVFRNHSIPEGEMSELLKSFGTSLYDYIESYLPEDYKDRVDECYNDFKKIYPMKVRDKMIVFSGVNETLEFLKKSRIKLSVLSCMIRKEVDANLALLSFHDFDEVFSLDDYIHKRPDPYGLLKIAEDLGIDSSEALYVGDTVNDIKMGKNAGMTTVAVKSGVQDNFKLEKEKPDFLIDSFKDLKNVIESLNS